MKLMLILLAIAVAVYLISDGRFLFLPFLLFLPLGLFARRRQER